MNENYLYWTYLQKYRPFYCLLNIFYVFGILGCFFYLCTTTTKQLFMCLDCHLTLSTKFVTQHLPCDSCRCVRVSALPDRTSSRHPQNLHTQSIRQKPSANGSQFYRVVQTILWQIWLLQPVLATLQKVLATHLFRFLDQSLPHCGHREECGPGVQRLEHEHQEAAAY